MPTSHLEIYRHLEIFFNPLLLSTLPFSLSPPLFHYFLDGGIHIVIE